MIHLLPPDVANRIAAGEVVERPASIVRELIDNAIDAGATRVDIEAEEGGLKLVRVTDNGCGMSRDDAVLCVKRHATSKIHRAEDLNAILTKGFRGEALAAISAVARVEIKTRPAAEDFGTLLVVEGSVEQEPRPVGTPAGTIVTVRDLFFNTPARRKFLKKPATEQSHLLAAVTWNALAHEDIHFTFTHNGRRAMELPPVASRAERVRQIYGKDLLAAMIPVQLDTPAVSISGLISRPTLTRNTTQDIFFFVNDRFVRDRLLHRAMMNGYRNLIPAGRFPAAFLYVEIDPREIDINVHPTKQEIKFSHEDAVFHAMYNAVRQAWDVDQAVKAPAPAPPSLFTEIRPAAPAPVPSHSASSPAGGSPSIQPPIPAAGTNPSSTPVSPATSTTETDPLAALNRRPLTTVTPPVDNSPATPAGHGLENLPRVEKKPDELFDARPLEESGELQVLGQLKNSYILAQGRDGLYVIDQHAAHERLMFEKFLAQSQNAPLASQALLFPLTIDFSPNEVSGVEENLEHLRTLGFELEAFGPRTYVARAIPTTLEMDQVEASLKDILAELRLEGSAQERKERALQTLACRAAVKFGDPLTFDEMEALVRGLRQIPRRHVCPHGRPAILYVADASLERAFKRTGF